MNTNTKSKRKLLIDLCFKISVSVIGNGFFEVSHTDEKVNLIGFDNDLSKKNIFIGAVDTEID